MPWTREVVESARLRSSAVTAVKAAARRPPVEPRYALDLGMFGLADEAERAEARLNQAGFSTVRFRQQEPARPWSVYLPLPREPEEARAVVARLHEDGFADAVVTAGAQAAIQIARAMRLRTAVRIAERLRGTDPRVAAEAPRAGQVTLRHGNFTFPRRGRGRRPRVVAPWRRYRGGPDPLKPAGASPENRGSASKNQGSNAPNPPVGQGMPSANI